MSRFGRRGGTPNPVFALIRPWNRAEIVNRPQALNDVPAPSGDPLGSR